MSPLRILDLFLKQLYIFNGYHEHYFVDRSKLIQIPDRKVFTLEEIRKSLLISNKQIHDPKYVKDFDLYWQKLVTDGYMQFYETIDGEEGYTITLEGIIFHLEGGYVSQSRRKQQSSLSQSSALWLATLAAVIATLSTLGVSLKSLIGPIPHNPLTVFCIGAILGVLCTYTVKHLLKV